MSIQKRLANNILEGWAKRTPPPGSDRVNSDGLNLKIDNVEPLYKQSMTIGMLVLMANYTTL